MEILLVAATNEELDPVREKVSAHGHTLNFLATGVGMVATTHALAIELGKEEFDLALNVGIAGSFDPEIKVGDVVAVVKDIFADMGVEDGEKFLDVFEMDLADPTARPFDHGILLTTALFDHGLGVSHGITVNKVHGSKASIKKIVDKYDPQTESMEGAAFYYCCHLAGVPALQIRAISNMVAPRDTDSWDIELALNNLCNTMDDLLKKLQSV